MTNDRIASLIGNAEMFPILRKWDFFNHAGVAPLPRVAADAVKAYADQAADCAYLAETWHRDIERLRQAAAAMIGTHRDEIAFVKNTSEGLCTVARGVDWQPGDRIVTTGVEYPANIYPWMHVAQTQGVTLVMVREETNSDGSRQVPLDKILAEAAHPRTRLVSLSHVEFASGQRHDLATIGRFCREHGKLLCVDAIQSAGMAPIDVQKMCIDYLSADGHKWLLGPEGAGIFYCRRELLAKTHPLVIGWVNVINNQDFGHYDYTLRSDAGRFESGSHTVPGLLGLKASVELLSSIGIPAIASRIKDVTDHLIAGLTAKGYQIISPRTGDQWSGIVSFVSPSHDHQGVFRSLRKEHHVEVAVREGRLRCSPHFYNTEKQIDRLIELLPGH